MHKRLYNHIKTLLFPCLAFSVVAGFLSAVIITVFKILAENVIHLSNTLYGAVRTNPIYLPLLILGAVSVGLVASLVLTHSRSCRGGGIPTSVAAIRGIVSFRWYASIFVLPFSALLTFLCGLPLGTEGPCVQMGTAVGNGVITCLGSKKHKGWRRYIMTGGASAGFSVATSSPIAAIIFSMEELHKKFSPILLTVVSLSVISAQVTTQIFASIGIGSVGLFEIPEIAAISPKIFFAPLLVGIVCGLGSILFTRLYHCIDKIMHAILKKLPVKVVIPLLFACVSVIGYFLSDSLGTGHTLTDRVFRAEITWYGLILLFLIRAVLMIVSNTSGATGGIFLPTIAFGALLGGLCAEAMIALGLVGAEHYILMVVLGISAFLGATSRIPITACVFAVESLGGTNNVLSVIIATIVALLVVESSGLEDFTDSVIKAKVRSISKGKEPTVIEVPLTVNRASFAVGKELQDILWPTSCVVISVKHTVDNHETIGISEGDVITVRYKTYNPVATAEEFECLVGVQSEHIKSLMNP
ncbi:MAG: chloride channel protein [Clostridia bacterium]|nr:chloride channel protein [Clostridia bacterium]